MEIDRQIQELDCFQNPCAVSIEAGRSTTNKDGQKILLWKTYE